MISQLEENLLHMECSRKRLNQDSRPNCVVCHLDVGLREHEDVIPQTRLEVVFHLGEVEVWTRTTLDEFVCIVEEVEGEVEKRAGNGTIVDCNARFIEMPATGTVMVERPDWVRACSTGR